MFFKNKLDGFLGEMNGLVLMYGPSSSGKSTFAMQSTLEFSKRSRVLFIDTEKSFSVDRIKLMEQEYENLLENVVIISIKSFDDQFEKIKQIEEIVKKGRFGYLVIDSFGFFYRHELHTKKYKEVNEKVIIMLRNLKHVAREGIPVLITNQVYSVPNEKDKVETIGKRMIRNFSDSIIELKLEPRKILVHKPLEKEALFKIDNSGFVL